MYNPYNQFAFPPGNNVLPGNATANIQYVNGKQSAEAFVTQPNQKVLLMDSNADIFYIVTSDASNFKTIEEYVEGIEEEICGAKDYIEKGLWYKSQGNTIRYNKYKEMAMQELAHADALHTFAVEDIAKLEEVFPEVPAEMMDKWNESHKMFVEKTAWVKQMMAM